jgi:hypothetical protein
MTTVREFQYLGFDWLEDDTIMVNGRRMYLEVELAQELNEGGDECQYLGCEVESFAWRANTGVRPEFKGVVEFELCDSDKLITHISALDFAAKVGGNLLIAKWRPHLVLTTPRLSVPSEKMKIALNEADYTQREFIDRCAVVPIKENPIFTQAMADAGELPPVGSMFRIHKGNYMMVGMSSAGSVVGEHCDTGEYIGFHARDCKPIDTRTDKEKAVDEAVLIAHQDGQDYQYLRGSIERLYDAGLLNKKGLIDVMEVLLDEGESR